MGWKTVRDHYQIDHIVHVRSGCLFIGGPYVHDLIRVTSTYDVILNPVVHEGSKLKQLVEKMKADQKLLSELISQPDTFERSISVYTYQGGEIIEKFCEETGWPNVTHDGEVMYDNQFSTSKEQVVQWAKKNAAISADMISAQIEKTKADLEKDEGRLAKHIADLKKLDAAYPDVMAYQ